MKMITCLVVLALASLISAQNVTVGVAKIQGTSFDAGVTGTAVFTTAAGGNITITLNISGITQNLGVPHGVHVHQFGDLSSGDGASVGSHWSLTGQAHGCPETNGTARHIGDTGNWNVGADGTLIGSKTLDLIGLTGGSSSVIGFAIILHNRTDDCVATTSSQNRLAWGVIGIANPTYYGNASQNLATPIDSYSAVSGSTQAVCVLQPAASQGVGSTPVSGTVYFTQTSNGIQVSAVINNLLDTKPRGFHIHQWGDLSTADAVSAGTHYTGPYYNTSQAHGIPIMGQVRPHHVGDMGNLFVYLSNGTANYFNTFNSFGLYGSVNSIIGRAVVLHNNTDDCTGSNGNSGARIAYCVIGAANPAYAGSFSQLTSVNSTQNIANCPSTPITTAGVTTGAQATGAPLATTSNAAIFSVCFMLIIMSLFA